MRMRVYELARELDVSSSTLLRKLSELGKFTRSASSMLDETVIARVRETFGQPGVGLLHGASAARQSSWRAGAVKAPIQADILRNVAALKQIFPVASEHQELLASLGSQFVYAKTGKMSGFEECGLVLVRFSSAIEIGFGFTREVLFFYSPHPDLQIRTFKAAKQMLGELPREVTPDILFFWSPDSRLREKIDDWSSGKFLAIPLDLPDEGDPISFISLLRDYIFSRDLFYETTPVKGERFFGRRTLLQELRDDVRNQRVAGLFGLRKAGKTSVLYELSTTFDQDHTIIVLRDLESLPSPPTDPIPDLLRDLVDDLLVELRSRRLRSQELADLESGEFSLPAFKRALQSVLRRIGPHGVNLVLMLDEIEYLTPFDRIDVAEGSMTSVSQFLGVLRSLVQENENFTFLLSGLTSAIIEGGRLYGRPNPLFSWAKASFLSPFERHEADDLARSLGRKMGISIEDAALESLFEASGGHAFLYRHLASHLIKDLPLNVFHREIRRADVLRALGSWRRLIAGNIGEMLNHIKRYYPDEAYLLEVLTEEPSGFETLAKDAPSAVGHLVSLGLIQESDGKFVTTPVLDLL